MPAATARPQTAMKRLAGVLAFVCLVLFLLAIEQKQTVAAWDVVRTGSAPAARRVGDWAARLPPKAAAGFERLGSTVARQTASLRAARSSSAAAAAAPRREPSRAGAPSPAATGPLTLAGAELRFASGETLRTRPQRIAYGRDAFASGQTFGRRLGTAAGTQIELREVVAPVRGQPVPPFSLCGGEPARVAALLQRHDRVHLMLFRTPTVGPDTPAAALCGVWSFPAR